jgi:hypothetical protein
LIDKTLLSVDESIEGVFLPVKGYSASWDIFQGISSGSLIIGKT